MHTFRLLGSLLATTLLLTQPAAAQLDNFFAGPNAGLRNTTGSFNTFIGADAGQNNTTGLLNTFVGTFAGFSNTTGSGNTFVGESAGIRNTTGRDNAIFGRNTGQFNTTGNSNAFFGKSAGEFNTTGSENAFFGGFAGLSNRTGRRNAFFGSFAGENNTTGINNTFMGNNAGSENTTGGSNVFVGRSTGQDNTTGSSNAFIGSLAGRRNTTGMENTFVGRSAGVSNITGKGNTYFGFGSGNPINLPGLTNATAIGHKALVSRSNSLVLGSIRNKNGASSDVNVGIGVDAPTFQLHLSKNSAAKPGSSSWTVASDKRLKTNVEAFTDGLKVLLQVEPVRYHYNGKAGMPTEKEYVGVIAQQMQQVAPYMVGEFVYQDTTGKEDKYLNYDASALTYILVNSVKELKKENETLQEENVSLQSKLMALEKKFLQLERRLDGATEPGTGSVARLWQNAPNPYNRTTVIKYFVPQSAASASIMLFNSSGQQVSDYTLTTSEGEITLSSAELAAGTYVYKLFVDGVSIDSKKLVLVR